MPVHLLRLDRAESPIPKNCNVVGCLMTPCRRKASRARTNSIRARRSGVPAIGIIANGSSKVSSSRLCNADWANSIRALDSRIDMASISFREADARPCGSTHPPAA